MDKCFDELINMEYRTDNTIPYFGNDRDGDCFDERDFERRRKESFNISRKNRSLLDNAASRLLTDEIIRNHEYVIDPAWDR